MEVPIPYRVYTKVSEKGTVWKIDAGCSGDHRYIMQYKTVEIVSGAVCKDHIHLCVCIPPKLSVSSFMGYLKGKSTLMIYDRHPELQSKWDKAFWARGYYVATIGNVTESAIKKYIAEQSEESRKEDTPSRL